MRRSKRVFKERLKSHKDALIDAIYDELEDDDELSAVSTWPGRTDYLR